MSKELDALERIKTYRRGVAAISAWRRAAKQFAAATREFEDEHDFALRPLVDICRRRLVDAWLWLCDSPYFEQVEAAAGNE